MLTICCVDRQVSHLSDHVEDADDADEVAGVGLAVTHLYRVVRQIHVRNVVPGVQQEVGDGEQEELDVGEVGEV